MAFKDIRAGERVRVSAARYNAVNRILNAFDGMNGIPFGKDNTNGLTIPVYNNSPGVLTPGTAISVYGDPVSGIYPAVLYPGFGFCGVQADRMEVGECGSMLISGIAKSGRFAGTGSYAAPVADTGTFQLGDSGFPVIFQGQDYIVMNLGGGGGAPVAKTNGFFTVKDATTSAGDPPVYTPAVYIYDDENPESGIAGAVHAGGTVTYQIPSQTLALQGTGTHYIYLQISYSNSFVFQFVSRTAQNANESDNIFFLPLAQVSVSSSSVSVLVQYFRNNMAFDLQTVAWV